MRTGWSLFLFFTLFLISCSTTDTAVTERDNGSAAETPEWKKAERPLPRNVVPPQGYESSILRKVRTGDGRPGPDYWQQFAEYDIDVVLDPEKHTLSGVAVITYHNQSPDTLRQLHLELTQNLHAEGVVRNRPAEVTGGVNLQRVEVDQTGFTDEHDTDEHDAEHRYIVRGTRLIIHPPEALPPGDSVQLEIAYGFDIPQRGAGGRMGYSDDNLFYLGYWYPHMVVYDDVVGWHPDPYRGQAEFYHGFGDYRLTIRVPEKWIVMATGELENAGDVLHPDVLRRWEGAKQSDEPMRVFTAGKGEAATNNPCRGHNDSPANSDGTSGDSYDVGRKQSDLQGADRCSGNDTLNVWRFSAEHVRDVAFSATLESHWDAARTPVGDLSGDGSTDYTVINSFWREDAPLWSEVTAYQQHAITWLSEMAGFSYPWPHMTAVEGAGIIGGGMEYPMMTIMGDYNQRGAEALYSVTAHELAHMWVPLIVSTDERRYSWLDEGNTVFSTAEAVMDYLPERRPHRQAQTAYIAAARTGNEGPIMRRSDYHYSTNRFIIASYRKPSVVLVALRQLLGEEVFNEAWRSFIREWALKQAYPWDFFRTFERVSGRDLEWFWHSWYYETWVLNQSVEKVEETDNGTRIVVRDAGDIPMPVYLTVTVDENREVQYTIPVDSWLKGRRVAEIEIPEQQVRQVEIDADRNLPDIDRSNMVWKR